jgi:hypothetical protein
MPQFVKVLLAPVPTISPDDFASSNAQHLQMGSIERYVWVDQGVDVYVWGINVEYCPIKEKNAAHHQCITQHISMTPIDKSKEITDGQEKLIDAQGCLIVEVMMGRFPID